MRVAGAVGDGDGVSWSCLEDGTGISFIFLLCPAYVLDGGRIMTSTNLVAEVWYFGESELCEKYNAIGAEKQTMTVTARQGRSNCLFGCLGCLLGLGRGGEPRVSRLTTGEELGESTDSHRLPTVSISCSENGAVLSPTVRRLSPKPPPTSDRTSKP